jgi:hypothetical protein
VQGVSHALCPAVSLKRHAIMFLKVASHPVRIDSRPFQFRVPDSGFRPANHLKSSANPLRSPAIGLQWAAPFARPVAGENRFTDIRKVVDVLRQRASGRAGRPAENSRGLYTQEKDSIVGAILSKIRPLHFSCRRHGVHHGTYCSPLMENASTEIWTSIFQEVIREAPYGRRKS